MKGAAYIVCGATGMGKSSFVKKIVSSVHEGARLIHDVNAEYTDLYKGKFHDDFEDFARLTTTVKKSLIVYEEATAFISNRGGNKHLRKVLVAKRHDCNLIFLVFHSLRSIPRDLYDLCNYVVLFKTSDDIKLVEGRFENPKLTQAFLQLQKAEMLGNGDHKYSPHLIVPIQSTM